MATLRTITLGCKVNQYETQYVREGLLGIGYGDAQPGEGADLCVVNTCTVTHEGDAKSRQVIRRLARENPGSRIVVMGCYATRAPEEVASLPGVAEVVTDKRELPDLLGRFGVVDIPTGISRFAGRRRAYVKVQDGCMLKCSYCIIPKVRPQLASRPVMHILDEVRRLRDNGYREMILTGIHLGHFGIDWNWGKPKKEWIRLADLLREILNLEGDFRIRLSSIEATEVTRELLGVMREHPNRVCPHLHVCLQSGSDRMLRAMRRRWGARRFADRCRLAQDLLNEPCLTTDVIVGYPGETDEDFEATCRIVREIGFAKIHIFPFSARRQTPAATLPDQVPSEVKQVRIRQLAEIERDLCTRYYQRLVGSSLQVLTESPVEEKGEFLVGTSCRYAPVHLPAPAEHVGRLFSVRATHLEHASDSSYLVARVLDA